MTAGVGVAVIAALPPTLAALLTFVQARAANRAAMRRAEEHDALGMAASLGRLRSAVGRVESAVDRIDDGVVDLRERVARLEGAHSAARRLRS